MANVTVHRAESPITGVTLELTPEEAYVVRSLVAHVAGNNECYDLSEALEAFGEDYMDIVVEYDGEYPVIRFN